MPLLHASGIVQVLASDAVNTTFDLTLGFTMKAMRFTWVGRAGTTDGVGRGTIRYGHGFATSASNRMCIGSKVVDAGAAADAGAIKRTDAVVATCDNATTPALDGAIDINSVTSTVVQLIVDDALPADLTIMWEAWGGSSITNAIVVEETVNTTTAGADIAITGVGFTGTIAFIATMDTVTLGNIVISDRCGISFGAFTGTGDEHVVCGVMTDDGSATSDTWSYCRAGECAAWFPAAMGSSPDCRLQFVQWDADGYTLDVIENARNNRRFITLVIQGGNWTIGSFSSLTSTGSISSEATGFGYAPAGVSVHSSWMTEHTADTATNHSQASHGVASKGGGQWALSCLDENGVADMECSHALDTDKVYAAISTGSAIEGLISVTTFGSDGITFNQDDADPGARFVWYIACGPADTGAVLTPSVVSAAFSIATPSLIKGARTLTPSVVTAVWATTTPQLLKVNVLTPAAVIAAWSVTTPTIVKGVRTLTPAPATAAWSVFTPTLIKGAVTLTPSPASAAWGVFTPFVSQGTTVSPSPVTATFTIATPTVVRGARILTPSAVTATWAVFTPTVVVGGGPQTLTPSPVTATWSVFTPTVVRGAKVLTPTTITAAWTVITPTVTIGARVLTPTPITAAWTVTTPSLITGARILTPTPATGFWSVFTPFVDSGATPAGYLGPHGHGQRGGWRRRG